MGCCFSSDEDKDLTTATDGERAPLLDPGHDAHIQQPHGTGSTYSQQNYKDDEQSEFSRILRQTAINVIDVTSSESQNLEQGEMQDRATQYSNRSNMVLSGKERDFRPLSSNGISSPQMILSGPVVSYSDIQLITSYSEKIASAARDIKVHHKENLIVTFGVP